MAARLNAGLETCTLRFYSEEADQEREIQEREKLSKESLRYIDDAKTISGTKKGGKLSWCKREDGSNKPYVDGAGFGQEVLRGFYLRIGSSIAPGLQASDMAVDWADGYIKCKITNASGKLLFQDSLAQAFQHLADTYKGRKNIVHNYLVAKYIIAKTVSREVAESEVKEA